MPMTSIILKSYIGCNINDVISMEKKQQKPLKLLLGKKKKKNREEKGIRIPNLQHDGKEQQ